MTPSERDSAHFKGFLLGLRVFMQAHGIEIPGSEDEKHWRLLQEIAEGRETIVHTPPELLRNFPDAPQRLHDELWRRVNAMVAQDREIARGILAAGTHARRHARPPRLTRASTSTA